MKPAAPRRRRLARIALASCLALTSAGSAGCFGKFALTRKLYTWNAGLGDKWVANLAFWGLSIIPVYPLVGFGDVIVLNTVEFWSGRNPVADARDVQTRETEDGAVELVYRGATFRLMPAAAEGSFDVTRDGECLGHATVQPDGTLLLAGTHGTTRIVPDERARHLAHVD